MFPLRSRQHHILPLGNWADNAVGKSYIRLHPKSEFQYYSEEANKLNGINITKKVPIPMVNNVFPKCVFTINFNNGYHLDCNDHEALTHCTITTPNPFVHKDKETVCGTFALGYNVFDFSKSNISFVFSGSRVSHCTGVPYNVPEMPELLKGNKSFKSINDNTGLVKNYLRKSVVAWAGFGATNVWNKKD